MTEKTPPNIYYSRFLRNPRGNGGEQRTYQIYQALSYFCPQFVSAVEMGPGKSVTSPNRVTRVLKKIFRGVGKICNNFLKLTILDDELRCWGQSFLPYVLFCQDQSRKMAASIKTGCVPRCVFVDDPLFFEPLVKKIKRCKIPLIGICHNIESLVYGQSASAKMKRKLFEREIDILSLCDLVVAISRDDARLLNDFDIPAVYFPFYPAGPFFQELIEVRERRKTTQKKDYLLLGTSANLPTRAGMIEVIQRWQEWQKFCGGESLIVMGYGTDDLAPFCKKPGIEFLGPVSNEVFNEKASTVRALICYQNQATGALTRIPSALVAGIPVIANFCAIRSHCHLEGIIEFLDLEDLSSTFSKVAKVQENLPIPKPLNEGALVAEILKTLNRL